jgi:outer membrane protein
MRSITLLGILSSSAFALVLVTTTAHADEQPHEDRGPQWGLGLGVSSETSPYQGVDAETKVLPMLSFENRYVRVLGPSLDLKLLSVGPVSLALRARYSDQGYKASDAAELQGMDERKGGLWLGARADWRLPFAQLSAEWQGDANGRSDGQQIKFEASRRVQVGAVNLKPRLALVWQDRSYVDYYYGVRAAESRAGRASYVGSDTVNTELGLQLNLPLAPGHSVFMDLSHTFLGSAIKDSPLVGRSGVSAVRVAYVYRF